MADTLVVPGLFEEEETSRSSIENSIDNLSPDLKLDDNLKKLLKETVAHEAHFGKLDPQNPFKIDPVTEQDMVQRFMPQLGHLGIRPNKDGKFDLSNPKIASAIATMKYITNPKLKNYKLDTQEERANAWKEIYNTSAGKGTPEQYLKSLEIFDMREDNTTQSAPNTFDLSSLNPFRVDEAYAGENGLVVKGLFDTPKAVPQGVVPDLFGKPKSTIQDEIMQARKGMQAGPKYGFDIGIKDADPKELDRAFQTLKITGQALTKIPANVGASILKAHQGAEGASVVNKGWIQKTLTDAQTNTDEFVKDIYTKYKDKQAIAGIPIKMTDIAQLPQNIAYSVTSMGAGLAAGAPIALIPLPGARVAAWMAGTVASGKAAYEMSTYEIMQEYLEAKNEESIQNKGRGITAEEETRLKKYFNSQAKKYGLWEAVPEALSNLAFAKIITAPLTKIAGKGIASRIVGKLSGLYGEELITETITQKGQAAIEQRSGLREGKGGITWEQAFKEVAPQTFLLTTVMAGAGQSAVSISNKAKAMLNQEAKEKNLTSEQVKIIRESIDKQAKKLEAEQKAQEEERIKYEAWLKSRPAYRPELDVPLHPAPKTSVDMGRELPLFEGKPTTTPAITPKVPTEGITAPKPPIPEPEASLIEKAQGKEGGGIRGEQISKVAKSVLEPPNSALSGFAHGKESVVKEILNVSDFKGQPVNVTILQNEKNKIRIILHGKDTSFIDAGALLRKEGDSYVVENIANNETINNAIPLIKSIIKENLGKIKIDKEAPRVSKLSPKEGGGIDFQERTIAAQDLADTAKEQKYRIPINSDGSITIYHGTSTENAQAINTKGKIESQSFFSPNKKGAEFYGKTKNKSGEILPIKVDARDIEYSTGTGEIYAPTGLVKDIDGIWKSPNRAKLSPKEGGVKAPGVKEIPATKSGQEYLSKPDNPLKTAFLDWAKLRLGEDYSGFKLSTYTDGEPYFKHPIGTEISLRDYINARDTMEKLSKKRKLTDKEKATYQANIKYFPELQAPTIKGGGATAGHVLVDMLNPARWDSVRQFIEDDWIMVKRLIQEKGAKVTETNNPYEAEIRYWGRLASRTEESIDAIDKIDKDIVNTSKKLKISDKVLSDAINKFLVARHAPERNAVHGDGAAGMTNAQADTITRQIASKSYAPEVERIADEIQKLNNQTLDVLLESGVISQELYDKLRTMYKNHIPLNRVMSENDDIVEVLTTRGFSVQGAGLKRAKGSELEIADILTNVSANLNAAIARAEKNIVDNHTLRFARENEYFGGLFEEVKLPKYNTDPHVLPIRENGNQVYLKINDAQLAMALKGVNRHKVEGLLRGVKAYTRFMAGLATRFNPEFVLSNKIRDLQEVAIYLASKKEIGAKGAAKTLLKDPQSIKDITDYFLGKNTHGTQLYKQMIKDGGTTGGLALSTRGQLELNINKIRQLNRSTPRKAVQMILESVDKWNTIFEDSSRLSVYRQALKQGVSRNRAAVLAKEASVNFNKMGTGGPVINALYMFSNASVQGTAKMLRAMKNPKVAALVLSIMGGAIFLVAQYNDEKDKDWRKKVSKWDRLNGLNIVISSGDNFRYVTIPISWGLKPINVFFNEVYDLVEGHETSVSEAVSSMFTAIVESYNPVGGSDAISAITPTILDLPIDIARNRSWSGGKIRPDWNNSAPASIKYFNSLREKLSGKYFIQKTRELGERGIEISPADVNYAYGQLIGGTGRFVNKALNTIVGVSKGQVDAKEIPFVSRFYRDIPKEEIREFGGAEFRELKQKIARQDKKRFYLKQEAELAWDGLKKIPVSERAKNYKHILKTNPTLAEKIKEVAKDEKRNLTYTERLVKTLGVENGERAKHIIDKLIQMKSVDERKKYYTTMKEKGIITDRVDKQIKILFKLRLK